jgi:hypothetical protein
MTKNLHLPFLIFFLMVYSPNLFNLFFLSHHDNFVLGDCVSCANNTLGWRHSSCYISSGIWTSLQALCPYHSHWSETCGWMEFSFESPILCVVSGRREEALENHVFLHLGSEVFVKIGPKADSCQVLETTGILLNPCLLLYS